MAGRLKNRQTNVQPSLTEVGDLKASGKVLNQGRSKSSSLHIESGGTTVMHYIRIFQSTTNHMYIGGPIRL